MKLKIRATIDLIRPIEHRGKFMKREFSVFTVDGNYYGMQTNYSNVYWLNDLKKGDEVEIDFELKGKPWSGKVFNNLLVEKITTLNDQGSKDYERAQEALKELKRNKPKFIKVDLHPKK
jgi:hypothetical protein